MKQTVKGGVIFHVFWWYHVSCVTWMAHSPFSFRRTRFKCKTKEVTCFKIFVCYWKKLCYEKRKNRTFLSCSELVFASILWHEVTVLTFNPQWKFISVVEPLWQWVPLHKPPNSSFAFSFQIEKVVGDDDAGVTKMNAYVHNSVLPCLACLAMCSNNNIGWRTLHNMVLSKTRHNRPEVRIQSEETGSNDWSSWSFRL